MLLKSEWIFKLMKLFFIFFSMMFFETPSFFFFSKEQDIVRRGLAYAARVKDIAHLRGVRKNQLVGYGLVVGLKGTGDGQLEYTNKSLQRMLGSLGVKVGSEEISTNSVAAVLVTAFLPPFARSGNKIDATVHVLGKASSLRGGTLVQTPLRAADEQVYAVAQGPLLMESLKQEGHETVAKLFQGAIIEKELEEDFSNSKKYILHLHHPDFTTAARVAKRINMDLAGSYAKALDASTISVSPPESFKERGVELMSIIESLDVSPDSKARVVVNEKTGAVVIGKNVRISSVAISYGNLSLSVGQRSGVGRGEKKKRKRNKERGDPFFLLEDSVSVEEVVKGFNRLGVSSRDLIAILQNIQAAGALHGELEVL